MLTTHGFSKFYSIKYNINYCIHIILMVILPIKKYSCFIIFSVKISLHSKKMPLHYNNNY
jgi:hypothetical protein